MNAQRLPAGLAVIASVGLLVLAALDVVASRRAPADSSEPPVPATRPAGSAQPAPGTQIAALHLFGRAVDAPPAPAPAPAVRPVLRLAGVLAGTGPDRLGLALIAADGEPERVYAPGSTLPGGVRLLGVAGDRVELLADGRREALVLVRAAGGPVATVGQGSAGGRSIDAAGLAAHLLGEPDPGAALARIAGFERVEPGQAGPVAGYRLRAGPDGRWLAQLGLRDGDIVTAIDGEPLADPDRALTLAAGLYGADEARLAVQRDGAPLALRLRFAATP